MISRMLEDTLWIYTAIGGSIIGAVVLAYLSTTRIGLWGYAKIDNAMDFLVERWGWTWLEQPEDAWRKKYPKKQLRSMRLKHVWMQWSQRS
jgi:hypothetical protein